MALALQDQNLVWLKVQKILQTGLAASGEGNPATQNAFRALRMQLATQMRAPQLQIVFFDNSGPLAATGYLPGIGVAFHLYSVWAKKSISTTGTTTSFLNIYNAATNATSTNCLISLAFTTAGDEQFQMFPAGMAFATDLVISENTTMAGATPTTGTLDGVSGFIVLGA